MSLHPQAQAMIAMFTKGPALDYTRLTAPEFRAAFDVPSPAASTAAIATIEDRIIEGAKGPMRARLYHPLGSGPFPVIIYLHGGGFVIGNPATTDGICRSLAALARSIVISPEYRLAPEFPFPAGLDDAWAALLWARGHASGFDGDASRIAVAGDSSGGTFAAALAQMCRAQQLPLRHQLLLYPVMDYNFNTRSYVEFASGYFLTADMMRWYWRQYLPDVRTANDWRACPLRQPDLKGLPPATILTAQFDVVRDEAELYASRLAAADVPVLLRRWPGQIHGFLLQQGIVDDADVALAEAAGALRRAFDRIEVDAAGP
jgi:acetyl esterase